MKITRYDFPDFAKQKFALHELMEGFPIWTANALLNFSLDAFRRQGWIDLKFSRWPQRASGDKSRSLLVQRARLKRSLRTNYGAEFAEISSNTKYAKAHNEGAKFKQRVTAKQRGYFFAMAKKQRNKDKKEMFVKMALSSTLNITIPKRQFMGESKFFTKRMELHIERGLKNALKP